MKKRELFLVLGIIVLLAIFLFLSGVKISGYSVIDSFVVKSASKVTYFDKLTTFFVEDKGLLGLSLGKGALRFFDDFLVMFAPADGSYSDDYTTDITVNPNINQSSIFNIGWDGVSGYSPISSGLEIDPAGPHFSNGLVGLWHLNETSGNATDSSLNNNNGSVFNAIQGVGGKFNNAYEFDGAGDYIDLGEPKELDFTSDFTLSVWIYPRSLGQKYIFSRGVNGWTAEYSLGIEGNGGRLQFKLANSTTGSRIYNGAKITANNWYHIVATVNATRYLVTYINGQPTGPSGQFGMDTREVSNATRISENSNNAFNGTIDEVAIWNRTLSASEIQTLYGMGGITGEFESNLINTNGVFASLNTSWVESGNGVNLSVTNDGTNWCSVSNGGVMNDPLCLGNNFKYKAHFNDVTTLNKINISWIYSTVACGNNLVELGEHCDDGGNCSDNGAACTTLNLSSCSNSTTASCNPQAGDGCSDICQIEQNWNCFGVPSVCVPLVNEICDDGLDNDGNGAIDYEDSACYTSGTIYYVSSSSGNDLWDGLSPSFDGVSGPKKTLLNASDILSNSVVGGDKLLFKRGDSWLENANGSVLFSMNDQHGTPSAPTVIGAYGTGSMPLIAPNGTAEIFSIYSQDNNTKLTQYIIIRDLNITTFAEPGNRPIRGFVGYGASVDRRPDHITVSNIVLTNIAMGFDLQGMNNFTLENSFIKDNHGIHPESGHTQGIFTSKINGLIIRNNTFINNGKILSGYDHNMYISHTTNILIEKNTILDSGDGIKLRIVENAILRDNYCGSCGGWIIGGENTSGIPSNATNILIERNIFENYAAGISFKAQSSPPFAYIQNVIVRNNQFLNAPKDYRSFIITLSGSNLIQNFSIYNNLFYNILPTSETRGQAIYNSYDPSASQNGEYKWANKPNNVTIFNNIFAEPEPSNRNFIDVDNKSIIEDGSITIDYNIYLVPSGGYLYGYQDIGWFRNLSELRTAYPNLEQHSIEGTPSFANIPDFCESLPMKNKIFTVNATNNSIRTILNSPGANFENLTVYKDYRLDIISSVGGPSDWDCDQKNTPGTDFSLCSGLTNAEWIYDVVGDVIYLYYETTLYVENTTANISVQYSPSNESRIYVHNMSKYSVGDVVKYYGNLATVSSTGIDTEGDYIDVNPPQQEKYKSAKLICDWGASPSSTVRDFSLNDSSSLGIDVGISLPGKVDFDYVGVSRPQGLGWDIGAYEFVSLIPAVCGDGKIGAGEECDDGGTSSGDGCNATCQIESGYLCTGEPSVCAQCNLTSASWSSNTAYVGDSVNLNVAGTNCANTFINYTIINESGQNVMNSSIQGMASWTADQIGTYYFEAVSSDGVSGVVTSPQLVVNVAPANTCLNADVDSSGGVDINDLIHIARKLNGSDVTGDGITDIFDLVYVATKIGCTP